MLRGNDVIQKDQRLTFSRIHFDKSICRPQRVSWPSVKEDHTGESVPGFAFVEADLDDYTRLKRHAPFENVKRAVPERGTFMQSPDPSVPDVRSIPAVALETAAQVRAFSRYLRELADALLSTGRTCRAGSDQPGGCGMSCRQVKAHLRGSLYAPAKGSLTDFAGSYLRPKERIVLVVDSGDQVEEQVRRPIRIGFDKVEGWLCVAALASTNGALASIRSVKFRELPALIAEDPDILVLDVRRRLGLQCSLW